MLVVVMFVTRQGWCVSGDAVGGGDNTHDISGGDVCDVDVNVLLLLSVVPMTMSTTMMQ
jgi:hypothetical protein